jgi:hypothetical protein
MNQPEKLKMELNPNGSIKAASVRHFQRVILKRRETQSIKEKLTNARNYGKVQLHQIAVVDDREFLRVKPEPVQWLGVGRSSIESRARFLEISENRG